MKRTKSAAINFQSQEGILVKDLKVLRCVGGKHPGSLGGFPGLPPPLCTFILSCLQCGEEPCLHAECARANRIHGWVKGINLE